MSKDLDGCAANPWKNTPVSSGFLPKAHVHVTSAYNDMLFYIQFVIMCLCYFACLWRIANIVLNDVYYIIQERTLK